MTIHGPYVRAVPGIFTTKIQLCHVAGPENRRID